MSDPDRELLNLATLRLSDDTLREVEVYRMAQSLMGGELPTKSQALRDLIMLGLESFREKQKRERGRR